MERIRYAAFLPNMKYVSVKIDDLLKCFTFIHCFLILEMVTVHPVFSVDHQTLLTHNHTIFPPTPQEGAQKQRFRATDGLIIIKIRVKLDTSM